MYPSSIQGDANNSSAAIGMTIQPEFQLTVCANRRIRRNNREPQLYRKRGIKRPHTILELIANRFRRRAVPGKFNQSIDPLIDLR